MADVTSPGSVIGASSTKLTPSGKLVATAAAALSASRVLPTPPGPERVRRGTSSRSNSSRTVASSRSRPINGVRGSDRDGECWDKAVVMATLAVDLSAPRMIPPHSRSSPALVLATWVSGSRGGSTHLIAVRLDETPAHRNRRRFGPAVHPELGEEIG